MELGGTENVILQLCKNFIANYDITVISSGGINLKKLDEMKIKHYEISNIDSKNPFLIIKNLKKIKKILKKEKFDIIHTHHRMAAFYVALAKPKNCKLIHTMHNTFSDKIKLTKFSLKNFKIVACGKTVEKQTEINYGFKFPQLLTISNGIDNSYIKEEIQEIQDYKNDGFYIFGFVGRFAEQKGLDILIKSFSNNNSKRKLFVYGDGPMKNEIIELIQDLSADNIIVKDFTSNPLNVISQLDCLVLPSRWEGLPLNILEAFGVETLVLCSDIESNQEIVTESTGFLFESDSIVDLSRKLDQVMSSDNRLKVIKAKEVFDSNYRIETFFKKYNEIYQ